MADDLDPPEKRKPKESGGRGRGKTGRGNAREMVAVALAGGATQTAAAEKGAVTDRTVRLWLTEAPFRDRVAELRAEMVAAAAGRLTDGMAAAADALNALVKSEDEDVRRLAAAKVIELGLKVREQTELADRLARVEAMLTGGTPDAGAHPQQAEASGDAGGVAGQPPGPAAGGVDGGPGAADG